MALIIFFWPGYAEITCRTIKSWETVTFIPKLYDARVKRSCVSCLHEKAWLWDPQNTEKQPFFEEKWADLRCFRISEARSAKKSVHHWGQNTFWPQHHIIWCIILFDTHTIHHIILYVNTFLKNFQKIIYNKKDCYKVSWQSPVSARFS